MTRDMSTSSRSSATPQVSRTTTSTSRQSTTTPQVSRTTTSTSRQSTTTPQVSRTTTSTSRQSTTTPQVSRTTTSTSRQSTTTPQVNRTTTGTSSNANTRQSTATRSEKTTIVTTPSSGTRTGSGAIDRGTTSRTTTTVGTRTDKNVTSATPGTASVRDDKRGTRPNGNGGEIDKPRGGNGRGKGNHSGSGHSGNNEGNGNNGNHGGNGHNGNHSGNGNHGDNGHSGNHSGNGHGHNGNHGYNPNNRFDYSSHHYRDEFSWNYMHHNWSRPLPPPVRVHRPAPWTWYRPIIPAGWHPYAGAPVIDRVLGLVFGTLYEASLDHLYYSGYYIDGYADGIIYLRDVPMLNLYWADVMLNYDYNRLVNAQFVYHSSYYNMSRYNRVYNSLTRIYGPPVYRDGMTISWYGGDSNGYVTLSMFNNAGDYYTTLSIGY